MRSGMHEVGEVEFVRVGGLERLQRVSVFGQHIALLRQV